MSRKFEEMRRLLAADVLDAAPRLLGWHLVSGELRARIPAQIRVRKGRRGSTVEIAAD